MGGQNDYVDDFINRMYGVEREQPIERLILSLDSLLILLNIPIRSNRILHEVKRKMEDHKEIRVSKKIMRKLIEVIVDSAKGNKVDIHDLENTFKESPFDLDTSNTIILPDAPDETQYEFKSILEDVAEGADSLAEKTQNSLDINIGITDKFIQNRKNERHKKLEELKEMREYRNINILPKKDSLYSWSLSTAQKAQRPNDKCNDILSRINDIIEKSEHPAGPRHAENTFTTDRVKKLETYESDFNQKMLTLLNELSDKLSKPSEVPAAVLSSESTDRDRNIAEKIEVVPEKETAVWETMLKHTGIGVAAGVLIGAAITYKLCSSSMPY